MGGSENITTRLSERFRVRSYEADPLGRLQGPILCRLTKSHSPEVRHHLLRHEDGVEVARARTKWRNLNVETFER